MISARVYPVEPQEILRGSKKSQVLGIEVHRTSILCWAVMADNVLHEKEHADDLCLSWVCTVCECLA